MYVGSTANWFVAIVLIGTASGLFAYLQQAHTTAQLQPSRAEINKQRTAVSLQQRRCDLPTPLHTIVAMSQ
jgi:hypothetical protein